ncbi:MAG: alpha/beta fold hydrolase, partial [bacterium]
LRAGRGLMRMFLPQLRAGVDSTMLASGAAQLLAQNDAPSLVASMSSLAALRTFTGRPPKVPALVICGTADPLIVDSRRLASWWAGSRLVEVQGATHAVLGRPEVSAAIVRFLKR